jgi:hypothetical protein
MPILRLEVELTAKQFEVLERLAEHEQWTPKAHAAMIIRKALDAQKHGPRFTKNHTPIEADGYEPKA